MRSRASSSSFGDSDDDGGPFSTDLSLALLIRSWAHVADGGDLFSSFPPSLRGAHFHACVRSASKRQELGGTAHHTGLRTGKELHAVSDSSSDDEDGGAGGGDEKQAGLSASAKKKKQVLAERKKFGAFLGAQSDEDSESD